MMKVKNRKIAVRNTLENFDNEELLILLGIGVKLAPKPSEYEYLMESVIRAFNNRLCAPNFTEHIEEAKQIKLIKKYNQLSDVDKDLLADSCINYWIKGCRFYSLVHQVFQELLLMEELLT